MQTVLQKKMKRLLVSDIMTRSPVIVKPDISLLECAKIMVKDRVGSLLLVRNKRLVGFISRRDILWAIVKKSKEDLADIKAIDISPRKIATLRPGNTVSEAIKKMKSVKFDRLPVIYKTELVGLLTIRDILMFQPEAYRELDELETIREEAEKLRRFRKAKDRKDVYEGECDCCGTQGILSKKNDKLVCEKCMHSI